MNEADLDSWFRELGYRLRHHQDDEWCWVDLISLSNPDFVVPRYGRGSSPDEAGARARQRWQVEQTGKDSGERTLP